MEVVKQWIIIHTWRYIAGIWVCLSVVLICFFIGGRLCQLVNSFYKWKANMTSIAEMENWESKNDQLSARTKKLEGQLNNLYISIPKNDQISIILDCLQKSSEGIALSLSQIKTESPLPFNTHQDQPLHVEAKGTFHAVATYIDRLEKSPFLIKTESLRIFRDGTLHEDLKAVFSLQAIVVAR